MNLKLITGVALAVAMIASGAQAATITNNEAKPQSFKVQSGDKQQSFTLMPADTVTIDETLCPEICVLTMQNGDEFEFALSEELTLEEGAVYAIPPAQGSANEPDKPLQQ